MNDKSHVSMERCVCLICGIHYDTGAILLDRRLRASMERYMTTGWGLCPEHRKMHEQGYIALVECDLEKSEQLSADDRAKPEGMYRTGRIAHLKREVFIKLFKDTAEADRPCVFVDHAIIERLQRMVQH